jgi:hypothetical protein
VTFEKVTVSLSCVSQICADTSGIAVQLDPAAEAAALFLRNNLRNVVSFS